jgi:hypothetical protein
LFIIAVFIRREWQAIVVNFTIFYSLWAQETDVHHHRRSARTTVKAEYNGAGFQIFNVGTEI